MLQLLSLVLSIITVPTSQDVVANGAAFQAALNNAQCGDTIVLQAGAVYQGPTIEDHAFFLRAKPGCSDFITITTSNPVGIAADGVRLTPATQALAMPKLVADTSSYGMPVLMPEIGANHYKLIGLEMTNTGVKYAPDIVRINLSSGSGPGGYPTYEEITSLHDFIFDRCFIHPAEISAGNLLPSTVERTSGHGINIEGVNNSVINSYVAGFAGRSGGSNIDSYGVFTVVGPGPLRIVNNYIEAQFNNVFTGGSDNYTLNTATVTNPALTSASLSNVTNLNVGDLVAFSSAASSPKPWETGQVTAINGNSISFTLIRGGSSSALIPPDNGGMARWNGINIHDVEIRRNTLNKPDIWNSFSDPKSFIELKDCVNCIVDGNYMYSGVGSTIALTPRNQNGSAPWAKIENLSYTNNLMIGYKWGVGSIGSDYDQPSVSSGSWIFRNNLWHTPTPVAGSSVAFIQLGTGFIRGHDISVTHNTILQPDHMIEATGVTDGQFIFKDNIVGNGEYGIHCYLSTSNLQACIPGLDMIGNVIAGPPMAYRPYCSNQGDAVYPTGNTCVYNAGLVGFTDLVNNNYRLAPTSPFKGAASDGKDPGVDIDALNAAINGATPPVLTPPTVAFTSPATSTVTTRVLVSATALAYGGSSINRMELWADGKQMVDAAVFFSGTSATIRVIWNPKKGTHQVQAKAWDSAGRFNSTTLTVTRQ